MFSNSVNHTHHHHPLSPSNRAATTTPSSHMIDFSRVKNILKNALIDVESLELLLSEQQYQEKIRMQKEKGECMRHHRHQHHHHQQPPQEDEEGGGKPRQAASQADENEVEVDRHQSPLRPSHSVRTSRLRGLPPSCGGYTASPHDHQDSVHRTDDDLFFRTVNSTPTTTTCTPSNTYLKKNTSPTNLSEEREASGGGRFGSGDRLWPSSDNNSSDHVNSNPVSSSLTNLATSPSHPHTNHDNHTNRGEGQQQQREGGEREEGSEVEEVATAAAFFTTNDEDDDEARQLRRAHHAHRRPRSCQSWGSGEDEEDATISGLYSAYFREVQLERVFELSCKHINHLLSMGTTLGEEVLHTDVEACMRKKLQNDRLFDRLQQSRQHVSRSRWLTKETEMILRHNVQRKGVNNSSGNNNNNNNNNNNTDGDVPKPFGPLQSPYQNNNNNNNNNTSTANWNRKNKLWPIVPTDSPDQHSHPLQDNVESSARDKNCNSNNNNNIGNNYSGSSSNNNNKNNNMSMHNNKCFFNLSNSDTVFTATTCSTTRETSPLPTALDTIHRSRSNNNNNNNNNNNHNVNLSAATTTATTTAVNPSSNKNNVFFRRLGANGRPSASLHILHQQIQQKAQNLEEQQQQQQQQQPFYTSNSSNNNINVSIGDGNLDAYANTSMCSHVNASKDSSRVPLSRRHSPPAPTYLREYIFSKDEDTVMSSPLQGGGVDGAAGGGSSSGFSFIHTTVDSGPRTLQNTPTSLTGLAPSFPVAQPPPPPPPSPAQPQKHAPVDSEDSNGNGKLGSVTTTGSSLVRCSTSTNNLNSTHNTYNRRSNALPVNPLPQYYADGTTTMAQHPTHSSSSQSCYTGSCHTDQLRHTAATEPHGGSPNTVEEPSTTTTHSYTNQYHHSDLNNNDTSNQNHSTRIDATNTNMSALWQQQQQPPIQRVQSPSSSSSVFQSRTNNVQSSTSSMNSAEELAAAARHRKGTAVPAVMDAAVAAAAAASGPDGSNESSGMGADSCFSIKAGLPHAYTMGNDTNTDTNHSNAAARAAFIDQYTLPEPIHSPTSSLHSSALTTQDTDTDDPPATGGGPGGTAEVREMFARHIRHDSSSNNENDADPNPDREKDEATSTNKGHHHHHHHHGKGGGKNVAPLFSLFTKPKNPSFDVSYSPLHANHQVPGLPMSPNSNNHVNNTNTAAAGTLARSDSNNTATVTVASTHDSNMNCGDPPMSLPTFDDDPLPPMPGAATTIANNNNSNSHRRASLPAAAEAAAVAAEEEATAAAAAAAAARRRAGSSGSSDTPPLELNTDPHGCHQSRSPTDNLSSGMNSNCSITLLGANETMQYTFLQEFVLQQQQQHQQPFGSLTNSSAIDSGSGHRQHRTLSISSALSSSGSVPQLPQATSQGYQRLSSSGRRRQQPRQQPQPSSPQQPQHMTPEDAVNRSSPETVETTSSAQNSPMASEAKANERQQQHHHSPTKMVVVPRSPLLPRAVPAAPVPAVSLTNEEEREAVFADNLHHNSDKNNNHNSSNNVRRDHPILPSGDGGGGGRESSAQHSNTNGSSNNQSNSAPTSHEDSNVNSVPSPMLRIVTAVPDGGFESTHSNSFYATTPLTAQQHYSSSTDTNTNNNNSTHNRHRPPAMEGTRLPPIEFECSSAPGTTTTLLATAGTTAATTTTDTEDSGATGRDTKDARECGGRDKVVEVHRNSQSGGRNPYDNADAPHDFSFPEANAEEAEVAAAAAAAAAALTAMLSAIEEGGETTTTSGRNFNIHCNKNNDDVDEERVDGSGQENNEHSHADVNGSSNSQPHSSNDRVPTTQTNTSSVATVSTLENATTAATALNTANYNNIHASQTHDHSPHTTSNDNSNKETNLNGSCLLMGNDSNGEYAEDDRVADGADEDEDHDKDDLSRLKEVMQTLTRTHMRESDENSNSNTNTNNNNNTNNDNNNNNSRDNAHEISKDMVLTTSSSTTTNITASTTTIATMTVRAASVDNNIQQLSAIPSHTGIRYNYSNESMPESDAGTGRGSGDGWPRKPVPSIVAATAATTTVDRDLPPAGPPPALQQRQQAMPAPPARGAMKAINTYYEDEGEEEKGLSSGGGDAAAAAAAETAAAMPISPTTMGTKEDKTSPRLPVAAPTAAPNDTATIPIPDPHAPPYQLRTLVTSSGNQYNSPYIFEGIDDGSGNSSQPLPPPLPLTSGGAGRRAANATDTPTTVTGSASSATNNTNANISFNASGTSAAALDHRLSEADKTTSGSGDSGSAARPLPLAVTSDARRGSANGALSTTSASQCQVSSSSNTTTSGSAASPTLPLQSVGDPGRVAVIVVPPTEAGEEDPHNNSTTLPPMTATEMAAAVPAAGATPPAPQDRSSGSSPDGAHRTLGGGKDGDSSAPRNEGGEGICTTEATPEAREMPRNLSVTASTASGENSSSQLRSDKPRLRQRSETSQLRHPQQKLRRQQQQQQPPQQQSDSSRHSSTGGSGSSNGRSSFGNSEQPNEFPQDLQNSMNSSTCPFNSFSFPAQRAMQALQAMLPSYATEPADGEHAPPLDHLTPRGGHRGSGLTAVSVSDDAMSLLPEPRPGLSPDITDGRVSKTFLCSASTSSAGSSLGDNNYNASSSAMQPLASQRRQMQQPLLRPSAAVPYQLGAARPWLLPHQEDDHHNRAKSPHSEPATCPRSQSDSFGTKALSYTPLSGSNITKVDAIGTGKRSSSVNTATASVTTVPATIQQQQTKLLEPHKANEEEQTLAFQHGLRTYTTDPSLSCYSSDTEESNNEDDDDLGRANDRTTASTVQELRLPDRSRCAAEGGPMADAQTFASLDHSGDKSGGSAEHWSVGEETRAPSSEPSSAGPRHLERHADPLNPPSGASDHLDAPGPSGHSPIQRGSPARSKGGAAPLPQRAGDAGPTAAAAGAREEAEEGLPTAENSGSQSRGHSDTCDDDADALSRRKASTVLNMSGPFGVHSGDTDEGEEGTQIDTDAARGVSEPEGPVSATTPTKRVRILAERKRDSGMIALVGFEYNKEEDHDRTDSNSVSASSSIFRSVRGRSRRYLSLSMGEPTNVSVSVSSVANTSVSTMAVSGGSGGGAAMSGSTPPSTDAPTAPATLTTLSRTAAAASACSRRAESEHSESPTNTGLVSTYTNCDLSGTYYPYANPANNASTTSAASNGGQSDGGTGNTAGLSPPLTRSALLCAAAAHRGSAGSTAMSGRPRGSTSATAVPALPPSISAFLRSPSATSSNTGIPGFLTALTSAAAAATKTAPAATAITAPPPPGATTAAMARDATPAVEKEKEKQSGDEGIRYLSTTSTSSSSTSSVTSLLAISLRSNEQMAAKKAAIQQARREHEAQVQRETQQRHKQQQEAHKRWPPPCFVKDDQERREIAKQQQEKAAVPCTAAAAAPSGSTRPPAEEKLSTSDRSPVLLTDTGTFSHPTSPNIIANSSAHPLPRSTDGSSPKDTNGLQQRAGSSPPSSFATTVADGSDSTLTSTNWSPSIDGGGSASMAVAAVAAAAAAAAAAHGLSHSSRPLPIRSTTDDADTTTTRPTSTATTVPVPLNARQAENSSSRTSNNSHHHHHHHHGGGSVGASGTASSSDSGRGPNAQKRCTRRSDSGASNSFASSVTESPETAATRPSALVLVAAPGKNKVKENQNEDDTVNNNNNHTNKDKKTEERGGGRAGLPATAATIFKTTRDVATHRQENRSDAINTHEHGYASEARSSTDCTYYKTLRDSGLIRPMYQQKKNTSSYF